MRSATATTSCSCRRTAGVIRCSTSRCSRAHAPMAAAHSRATAARMCTCSPLNGRTTVGTSTTRRSIALPSACSCSLRRSRAHNPRRMQQRSSSGHHCPDSSDFLTDLELTMTRAENITRLRGFIEETFLYMRPDFELGDDDSLMGKGIVDSMGVMEVIAFIDEELGVTVADTDVTEQNLGTINAIANYVLARQQATQV